MTYTAFSGTMDHIEKIDISTYYFQIKMNGMGIPMEFKWHEFGRVASMKEMCGYLQGREWGHGGYYHYTSLAAVESILGSQTYRLSCVDRFNDEAELKGIDVSRIPLLFSLCFSTGQNENLPLWYLYSGLDGQGGRLGLTKAWIKRLVNESDYSLSELDDDGKTVGAPLLLKPGVDMDITFRDVLYCREDRNKGTMDLKYNTMTNHILPIEEGRKTLECMEGFHKGLIWYYEKETRLLVKLKGKAAKRAREGCRCAVMLRFSDNVRRNMRIMMAPEINSLQEAMKEYPSIRRHYYETKKVQLSEYAGTIHMRLRQQGDREQ